jgi:hypothetical protein
MEHMARFNQLSHKEMGFIVYPLGKFVEWLGLVNRSAIPTDVTSNLVIAAMLFLWLVVGTAAGSMTLLIGFRRLKSGRMPRQASEHGL